MTSKTQTQPPPSIPDIPTPDLLRDLLDPGLTSIEVTQRHNLDPIAYRAAVQSEAFREAAEALRDADQERTELLTPLMHARALHTLARIANQPTTTPSQTESARRASTALLKVGRHSVPTLPSPGGTGVPPVLPPCRPNSQSASPPRGADLQSASRAQPEPPTPTTNPTPIPNPLAAITGDPTMTFEDSLRLIAEIDAMRTGRAARPSGTALPPLLLDLAAILTPALPTPPQPLPTPAAQLATRAGKAIPDA